MSRKAGTTKAAVGVEVDQTVVQILEWLESEGTEHNREGMKRYGIVARQIFGVSVAALREKARLIGKRHELAEALWATGWYEARMLAAFVDEPKRVTVEQMERWASSFENWADCDTTCFHLFDKTPFAFAMVNAWHDREEELIKRAAFALLASLALHDKKSGDEAFDAALGFIEAQAGDGRNFVKKGVSWALRGIGRRSLDLHARCVALAERLAASKEASRRWIGKDALRDLAKPAAIAAVSRHEAKRSSKRR
jgi:3-methyladenine DNA glycosylase AlkD